MKWFYAHSCRVWSNRGPAVTGGSLALTVLIISVLLAIGVAVRMSVEMRPGPAWPSRFGWRFAFGTSALLVVGYSSSTIRGGVGLHQLILVFGLLDPLSIFLNTARDASGGRLTGPNEAPTSSQNP